MQLLQKRYHNTVFGMTMQNRKIQRTNESKGINRRHQNTNLMIGPSCGELDVVDEREKSTDVIEELILGRTEEKMKIMDILHGVMSENIVILPIYGIGGIGKTTFARLIYNDQKFKHYSHVWVDVSLKFDLNKIRKSIVLQLSGKESQDNEIQILHSCLTKLLASKNILIVLDDLWEDDQLQLQELKNMLYHDTSKMIVLVTTRSERVAGRICANLQSYKILLLTNDMCWDIIRQRSGFEDRDDKHQLMGIGFEISQKCGGVPLAAQSLGFTLRSMNFDQWKDVQASGIWNEPISKEVSLPNHILASLKLSYSYMDPCLKPCFAYCAIFPKGHKIVKNDIVYQWISLGFIKPTKLLSHMQLSEKYIVQLLGLSFFQNLVSTKNVQVNQEDAIVFTKHDLVHDLARSVMVNGVLDVGKQGNIGGKISISVSLSDSTKSLQSFTQNPSEISAMRSVECEKVVLYGASTSSPENQPFLLSGQIGIHEDVFSFAKYLRVLDLSEHSIQELPNTIGDLKQLRYLSVSGVKQVTADYIAEHSKLIYLSICRSSSILALSESIGVMEDLMYLDLSGCSLLEGLPQSFGKLKELVHLDLSRCSQVTNISESLERLTKLEYLNLSYCSNIGDLPKHLGSLLQLRNLDLSYSSYIDGTANVAILATLTKLQCLNLASHLSYMENLAEALRGLNNLKYLNLSCVDRDLVKKGNRFRFRNLKNLPEFKGVHGILEVFCSLTKLQYLNLSGFSCYLDAKADLYRVAKAHLAVMSKSAVKKEILNLRLRARETFATFLECISSKLPHLEHLDLSYNDPFIRRLPNSFGSLGKLHTLNLSGCQSLDDLPINLYDTDSLRSLDLTGCRNVTMPEKPGVNRSLISLPHFVVQADYHDPSSNLILLQDVNSTDLVISKLENVKSTQEARDINLKGKTTMEKMELKWTEDVDRFVEDMEVLGELVPPTTLEEFKIVGYNSVRFPEWFVGNIAFHLPNLVRISMYSFPQCNSLPPLGQLPNLKDLTLEGMNGISEINWDLCDRRRAFPQLKYFSLCKMESLEVWYTTYSHDGDDGVNEFMFPNFSLKIVDCPNLRLEPCPHRLSGQWEIQRSDGVISSWGEGGSRTSVSSPSSARITYLHVVGCKLPMHQWRLLHHLPGLTKLSIEDCSDLSSSPEITQALSTVREMHLQDFSKELELPNWLGELASLEKLTLCCYEVMEPHDGFPRLTWLRSLRLSHSKSIATVQQWVGSLVSLQRLEISVCKNLNDLAESFGRLTSLQKLEIKSCHSITSSLLESIGCLMSLQELKIGSCNSITSLPESIGYLRSLEELYIYSCDSIMSLPDNIGCLSSLNTLRLTRCGSITSLPESIQQLTKLKWVYISECKELEEWCKKAKLAHINVDFS